MFPVVCTRGTSGHGNVSEAWDPAGQLARLHHCTSPPDPPPCQGNFRYQELLQIALRYGS